MVGSLVPGSEPARLDAGGCGEPPVKLWEDQDDEHPDCVRAVVGAVGTADTLLLREAQQSGVGTEAVGPLGWGGW